MFYLLLLFFPLLDSMSENNIFVEDPVGGPVRFQALVFGMCGSMTTSSTRLVAPEPLVSGTDCP